MDIGKRDLDPSKKVISIRNFIKQNKLVQRYEYRNVKKSNLSWNEYTRKSSSNEK